MNGGASDPGDRELVSDFLAARSERAFLALYDRHTPGLYRFAARLAGRGGAEAADLVQEAWLRALAALPAFRGESSLRTWLSGIVLNRWREERARAERGRRLALVEGARPPREPADAPDRVTLERALARLPEGYREVLLLHDLEGYTHEEIARHFGIVEGTSKSQLARARRAIRAELAPADAGGRGGTA